MSIRINYTELMSRINREEFERYFRVHNAKAVAKKFNLHSESVACTLAKKWKIKKTPEDIKQTLFNTNMERYGNKWAQCSEEVRNKISKTVSSSECQQRMRNTCKQNHGVENIFEDTKYIKKCLIEKYGVDNAQKVEEIALKGVKTRRERYGEGLELISDKIYKTRVERFGTYWTDEMYEKSCNTKLRRYGDAHYQNVEKAKATSLERYGATHFNKTQAYRDLFTEEYVSRMKEKEYKTKKLNGTFNKSKGEEQCFSILVDIFGKDNVTRQYKEPRYPYFCDFYIRSDDLFVEYNGFWSHGDHPFDKENTEDQENKKLLEEKSNTNQFYRNVLVNWTITDVNKINCAITNELKYIAIYPTSGYCFCTDKGLDRICEEILLRFNL